MQTVRYADGVPGLGRSSSEGKNMALARINRNKSLFGSNDAERCAKVLFVLLEHIKKGRV